LVLFGRRLWLRQHFIRQEQFSEQQLNILYGRNSRANSSSTFYTAGTVQRTAAQHFIRQEQFSGQQLNILYGRNSSANSSSTFYTAGTVPRTAAQQINFTLQSQNGFSRFDVRRSVDE
jgi:hypothetical protein